MTVCVWVDCPADTTVQFLDTFVASGICACTYHLFYNAPSLNLLVTLQAALTCFGNGMAFDVFHEQTQRSSVGHEVPVCTQLLSKMSNAVFVLYYVRACVQQQWRWLHTAFPNLIPMQQT